MLLRCVGITQDIALSVQLDRRPSRGKQEPRAHRTSLARRSLRPRVPNASQVRLRSVGREGIRGYPGQVLSPEAITAGRLASSNLATAAFIRSERARACNWFPGLNPIPRKGHSTHTRVIRWLYHQVYHRVSWGVRPGVFVGFLVSCWGATAWGRQGLAPLRFAAPGPSAIRWLARSASRPTLDPGCQKGQGHAPSSQRTAAG